jgi:hypothetical protein
MAGSVLLSDIAEKKFTKLADSHTHLRWCEQLLKRKFPLCAPANLETSCLLEIAVSSLLGVPSASVSSPVWDQRPDYVTQTVEVLSKWAPSLARGRICHLPPSKSVAYAICIYNFIRGILHCQLSEVRFLVNTCSFQFYINSSKYVRTLYTTSPSV